MDLLRILFHRCTAFLSAKKLNEELEQEIDSHISFAVEENLKRGMSQQQARTTALRDFGGVAQITERYRIQRGLPFVEVVERDLRFAIRRLCKSPGFAITAVLMLALGIGATTAIFSVVEGVLLRPLPFHDPARLVMLADAIAGMEGKGVGVTAPDIRAYTRESHSFSDLGGYMTTTYEISGAGDPVQAPAARMSGGVFAALGVQPLLGRVFTQQEDDQGQSVAVLSYSFWEGQMHGDPQVLGSKILLDRKPYVVIGVMPRSFEFPLLPGHVNASQLWAPMSFTHDELTSGVASWNYSMVGRLKPGITLAEAQSDADRVAQQIMRTYPAFMSSIHISTVVRPLQEDTVAQARPLVRTLFFAVAVVLLIACANLAGLLLVRAIRRSHEVAICVALGANTKALLRQALLESLLLSIAGGVLGLAFAAAALRVGLQFLPDTLPRISEIGLDWQVVAFALSLAVLTGIVCGLAPAFAALSVNVNGTLKEGGRSGLAGGGHARLRSLLVIAEIAIALVLLAASGLLLRSFEKMREVNLGFRPDHTLTASYALPKRQYASQVIIDGFSQELLRRLRQLPGVEAAAMASELPASGAQDDTTFLVDGDAPPKGASMNLAWPPVVQGDYFRAMGIPLLHGRLFTGSDKADAQLVVIVNHKLAEHYWPGQDPIGKRVRIGTPESATPWLTVVGEVGDVKQDTPDGATKQQMYRPGSQDAAAYGSLSSGSLSGSYGSIVLRTAMPPEQMENALRATVRSLDPQLPLDHIQTMEQAVSDSEAARRFNTALISAFAIAAVLLAVLGVYSVIAFSVALRTQEMAIRMALGSPQWEIVKLVLTSGAKLAAVGCGLGLLGAVAASELLRSLLFGVSPFDPLVLTFAAVVILLLALAASAVPAMRAASVEPSQALRE